MSSGMKRKVALMAVLLPKVELLILDEPTNTLDPIMRDEAASAIAAGARPRAGGALFVARAQRGGASLRPRRHPPTAGIWFTCRR